MRRTSPSSEGKAPHEWSERLRFQEPYATSFMFHVSERQKQQRNDVLSLMMHNYKKTQPCMELGNPWFHSDYALGPKTLDGSLRRNLQESPKALVPHSRGIGRSSMGGAIVS